MGKVLVLEQILKLEKTSFLNNYIIEKSFIWKEDLNEGGSPEFLK